MLQLFRVGVIGSLCRGLQQGRPDLQINLTSWAAASLLRKSLYQVWKGSIQALSV